MPGTRRPERMAIPDLAIRAAAGRARLDALVVRAPASPSAAAAARSATDLLATVDDAAHRRAPRTSRATNWWSGTLNDVGYRSLHAATTEMVALFGPEDVRAALPEAVGRIQRSGIPPTDPRRLAAHQALTHPEGVDTAALRQLVAVGYEVADDAYNRVRGFRNVVLLAALLVAVVGGVFVGYVAVHPGFVPLCFDAPGPPALLVCPTSETPAGAGGGPTAQDVVLVALLGLLGAVLSAAVSLRGLRGTGDPYSVPLALTALKIPTGALTAVVALMAVRAGFVPGLTALDSQAQVLAYALLFGYAQQLLTGVVDRQGASVLAAVPRRAADGSEAPAAAGVAVPAGAVVPLPGAAGPVAAAVDEAPADPVSDGADDDADDSDLPDHYQQDVADGGIDEDGGVVEDLPDEDGGVVEDLPDEDDEVDEDNEDDELAGDPEEADETGGTDDPPPDADADVDDAHDDTQDADGVSRTVDVTDSVPGPAPVQTRPARKSSNDGSGALR